MNYRDRDTRLELATSGIIGKILSFFKVFLYILINKLKRLVVLAKIMPIADVNRIAFVNKQSISQFVTSRQPFADWHIFFHNTYQVQI